MNLWPNDPSGSSPAAAWFRKLLAAARQCTPLSIEGFSIERTSSGFNARKNTQPTAGGKKGTTIDANYKLLAIIGFGSSLTPPIPDLLICSSASANGAISNDTVYVAKARHMRRNAKEFFPDNGANVTQNYTYFGATSGDSTYGENFRTGTDGLNTELETTTPRYLTKAVLTGANMPIEQCLIYAVDTGSPTGITAPGGAEVTRVEVIPSRMWSKVVNA